MRLYKYNGMSPIDHSCEVSDFEGGRLGEIHELDARCSKQRNANMKVVILER